MTGGRSTAAPWTRRTGPPVALGAHLWDDPGVAVEPPFPRSYWVVAGRLAAGAYPDAPPGETGVDVVVDLTAADEGLARYDEDGVRRLSFPVRDFSVPGEDELVATLDAIDAELTAGRVVYLHCRGGLGRTGTVVGCWLARHGTTGEAALERVAELSGSDSSPETDEQRALVRRWPAGG